MRRQNNYLIQAAQAKTRFLGYDQQRLVEKFHLAHDGEYFYVNLLGRPYRLDRKTGDLEFREGDVWQDGNSYEEVMTLLDLLCDSRDDRFPAGQWQNMQHFGRQFHRSLLEEPRDPLALAVDRAPEAFRAACAALGGEPVSGGDMGYAFQVFDGLKMALLFWHGDEEFLPRLRVLWDANAGMYLRYETMYFALGLLKRRLAEQMA